MLFELTKIIGKNNAEIVNEILKLDEENERAKVIAKQPYQFFKKLKYLDNKIACDIYKVFFSMLIN